MMDDLLFFPQASTSCVLRGFPDTIGTPIAMTLKKSYTAAEIASKEPDMRRVVKKLVKFSPPCTAELVALMDCMKARVRGVQAAHASPA